MLVRFSIRKHLCSVENFSLLMKFIVKNQYTILVLFSYIVLSPELISGKGCFFNKVSTQKLLVVDYTSVIEIIILPAAFSSVRTGTKI